MIQADGSLIRYVTFVSNIHVVIAIHAASNDRRGAHHGHAATTSAHSHVQVRARYVLLQEGGGGGVNQVVGNDVTKKRIAENLRIARADRPRRIECRVRMSAKRV